jgi:hypothetical protein
MKSQYFEYAVFGSGLMRVGYFSSEKPMSIEWATKRVAHRVQAYACKKGISFDLANFSVAIKRVTKLSKKKWDILARES